MKLALQPARRNRRTKSAPSNASTCAQCPSLYSQSRFFRNRSSNAKRHANKPFRMNTCESVSKQRTLTPFRINTYEKQGEGGPDRNLPNITEARGSRGRAVPSATREAGQDHSSADRVCGACSGFAEPRELARIGSRVDRRGATCAVSRTNWAARSGDCCAAPVRRAQRDLRGSRAAFQARYFPGVALLVWRALPRKREVRGADSR